MGEHADDLIDQILCGELEEDFYCDHEGFVTNGKCEMCGETGLESDAETYDKENPR